MQELLLGNTILYPQIEFHNPQKYEMFINGAYQKGRFEKVKGQA